MNSRRAFIVTLAGVLAAPLAAEAQKVPPKTAQIGYLSPHSGPSIQDEAFRQGLRELGYLEGQNIFVQYRWPRARPDCQRYTAGGSIMSQQREDDRNLPKPATSAYDIRTSQAGDPEEVVTAAVSAITEAIELQLAALFDDIDTMLRVSEPFVEQEILRTHIMAKATPPAGTKYGMAVVPGSAVLAPHRWYVVPLPSPPAYVLVVPVQPEIYAEFRKGWAEGLTRYMETKGGTLPA